MHDKRYAIVVAGGKGERMGTTVPKQFLVLAGLPILMHTLRAFHKADPKINIVLVLPASEILFWKQLCIQYDFNIKHLLIEGGPTRFASVKNGLDRITESGLIAVHDGVRPFVSKELILNAFEVAAVHKTAVPAVKVSESIRVVDNGVNKALDRSKYFLIQTPQCFSFELLKSAYEQPFEEIYTDDASVVEGLGATVHLIEGNRMNFKITSPEDLLLAEACLKDNSN
jgi:2-C-methyl-D-erythritol 4-phosphate cytidylyltransferase